MRVGVGISGGVDSAAAAYFLRESGAEVVCYTMLLCGEDSSRAEGVAEKLGLPLRVVDMRGEFAAQVREPFVEEYAAGRTPSPCVRCNRAMKFGCMMDCILGDGCERVATGHYARIEAGRLLRGRDRIKDQSYFLAQVPVQRWGQVLFPLGDRLKAEVKDLIRGLGIVAESEKESQDLCFMNNGGILDYVGECHPELVRQGEIRTMEGKRLGYHRGACAYTVGQRRGLGLGGGPWFVVRTDVRENLVIVGREEDIQCGHVDLDGVNWLMEEPVDGMELMAQLRYQMKPRRCCMKALGGGRWRMEFPEGAPMVPGGQLAVGYLGDQVAVSGWIE